MRALALLAVIGCGGGEDGDPTVDAPPADAASACNVWQPESIACDCERGEFDQIVCCHSCSCDFVCDLEDVFGGECHGPGGPWTCHDECQQPTVPCE